MTPAPATGSASFFHNNNNNSNTNNKSILGVITANNNTSNNTSDHNNNFFNPIGIGSGDSKHKGDSITNMISDFVTSAYSGAAEKPGLDNAKLKFLRYRCLDVQQTIDFYLNLGMVLDSQVENEDYIFLTFAFKTSSTEFNDSSFSLLFEYNKREDHSNVLGKDYKDPLQLRHRAPYGHQYLVIYVHFLARIVKRMDSRGFQTFHEMKTPHDVSVATLYDPNNMEIRLIECTNAQLIDNSVSSSGASGTGPSSLSTSSGGGGGGGGGGSNSSNQSNSANSGAGGASAGGAAGNTVASKATWFARVGYCVITCVSANSFASFYERTFSTPKQGTTARQKNNKFEASSIYEVNFRKQEKSDQYLHRLGFHIVDSEVLISGSNYSQFLWLGNELRDKGSTICLCERLRGGTVGSSNTSNSRRNFNPAIFKDQSLLGFCYSVPVLETAMNTLAQNPNVTGSINYVEEYGIMPDLGYYSRFGDPLNYSIDLFSSIGQIAVSSNNNNADKKSGSAGKGTLVSNLENATEKSAVSTPKDPTNPTASDKPTSATPSDINNNNTSNPSVNPEDNLETDAEGKKSARVKRNLAKLDLLVKNLDLNSSLAARSSRVPVSFANRMLAFRRFASESNLANLVALKKKAAKNNKEREKNSVDSLLLIEDKRRKMSF